MTQTTSIVNTSSVASEGEAHSPSSWPSHPAEVERLVRADGMDALCECGQRRYEHVMGWFNCSPYNGASCPMRCTSFNKAPSYRAPRKRTFASLSIYQRQLVLDRYDDLGKPNEFTKVHVARMNWALNALADYICGAAKPHGFHRQPYAECARAEIEAAS